MVRVSAPLMWSFLETRGPAGWIFSQVTLCQQVELGIHSFTSSSNQGQGEQTPHLSGLRSSGVTTRPAVCRTSLRSQAGPVGLATPLSDFYPRKALTDFSILEKPGEGSLAAIFAHCKSRVQSSRWALSAYIVPE